MLDGHAGPPTVLVVEDSEPLRKMICVMLAENGYCVIEAADGIDALAILERQAAGIQLVLTDVIMPRMNGRDLAICASRISPELPVIFMSGYADDPVVRAVESGGQSFLPKPFTAPALISTVRQVLSTRDGAEAAP